MSPEEDKGSGTVNVYEISAKDAENNPTLEMKTGTNKKKLESIEEIDESTDSVKDDSYDNTDLTNNLAKNKNDRNHEAKDNANNHSSAQKDSNSNNNDQLIENFNLKRQFDANDHFDTRLAQFSEIEG